MENKETGNHMGKYKCALTVKSNNKMFRRRIEIMVNSRAAASSRNKS